MPQNPIGYALFKAINENDLDTFHTILGDNPSPEWLLLTDHCDDRLQKELGGDWSAYEGKFGRHENNTLLNFALSMERTAIAKALIALHKKHHQQQIFTQANNSHINPLRMLYMIHGEFLKKYTPDGQLILLKTLNKDEKDTGLKTALEIMSELLPHYSSQQILSCLEHDLRLLALPEISVALLKRAALSSPQNENKTAISYETQKSIHLVIKQHLDHLDGNYALKAEAKQIEEVSQEFKQMPKKDFKKHVKDKSKTEFLAQLKREVLEAHQLTSQVENNYEKIYRFLQLLIAQKSNPNLRQELITALSSAPELSVKDQLGKGGPASPDDPALIFHLIGYFENAKKAADKAALFKIICLVANPVAHLQDENGKSVADFINQNRQWKDKAINEEKKADADTPEIRPVGLIAEYEFRGQHYMAPFKGARSCTAISLSIAARLLRMNNNEFFNVFDPLQQTPEQKAKIRTLLSGCVQTGYDLNAAASTGFFDMLMRKDTGDLNKAIAGLPANSNIGGVKELAYVEGFLARIKDNEQSREFYPDTLVAVRERLKKSPVTLDGFVFVLTAAGHTTAMFSRKDKSNNEYFYLVDSRDTLWGGKMDVFDNFDTAYQHLLEKWQGHDQDYVAMSAFTTHDRLESKFNHQADYREEKLTTEQKIEKAMKAISENMNTPTKPSGRLKGLFTDSFADINRANVYLALLSSADATGRKLILFALLNDRRDSSKDELRTSALLAMGYFSGNEKNDLQKAKTDFKNAIELDFSRQGKSSKDIKAIITLIHKSAATGKINTADENKLSTSIKKH